MTILKFSKKSQDISKFHKNFMKQNLELIKKNKSNINILKKQKKREKCKNCNSNLKKKICFTSHNEKYKFCQKCKHLNSYHYDSKEFHDYIYKNDISSYSNFYNKNFNHRVNKIYTPKVNFLLSCFRKLNIGKFDLLDYGCGAGHFLKALEKKNIKAKGLETSKNLVYIANRHLKKNSVLLSSNTKESLSFIKNSKFKVISLIHVLEHLEFPNEIFKAFKKSSSKYLYIALPLVSFALIIDIIFQNSYPRHSAITHNNLYTYKSIKYILNKFKLKIISEWWFGSDFNDLQRALKIQGKNLLNDLIDENFSGNIDKFQRILDKSKNSSEVHLLISK